MVPIGAAQTSHPAFVVELSDDHVKAVDSDSPMGPFVPSYVTPFTISLS